MNTELDHKTIIAAAAPWDAGSPAIHGPGRCGASPCKDFMHAVPTVGERPLRFTAEGLPAGLQMNAASGIITGRAAREGEYQVLLKAANRHGTAEKNLSIVIAGNAIALTPPMGWNSGTGLPPRGSPPAAGTDSVHACIFQKAHVVTGAGLR